MVDLLVIQGFRSRSSDWRVNCTVWRVGGSSGSPKNSPCRLLRNPMSSRVEGLNAAIFIPLVQRVKQAAVDIYRDVFEGHRHRIFSLAFYMTDNELTAEEVLTNVFCRVFAKTSKPDAETV